MKPISLIILLLTLRSLRKPTDVQGISSYYFDFLLLKFEFLPLKFYYENLCNESYDF